MRSPHPGMTMQELLMYESKLFAIETGRDFFNYKKSYTFTKQDSVKLFNKIRRAALRALEIGTDDEKLGAKRVLQSLRIVPLRIH
jgi:hypothetical protein